MTEAPDLANGPCRSPLYFVAQGIERCRGGRSDTGSGGTMAAYNPNKTWAPPQLRGAPDPWRNRKFL
jgi:hypothetical protein